MKQFRAVDDFLLIAIPAFKNTFLTQLTSINIRSREFPNTLTKMLASQEGMNAAMSLQGDDAVTLVDILDQVSNESRGHRSTLFDLPHTGFRGSEYGD